MVFSTIFAFRQIRLLQSEIECSNWGIARDQRIQKFRMLWVQEVSFLFRELCFALRLMTRWWRWGKFLPRLLFDTNAKLVPACTSSEIQLLKIRIWVIASSRVNWGSPTIFTSALYGLGATIVMFIPKRITKFSLRAAIVKFILFSFLHNRPLVWRFSSHWQYVLCGSVEAFELADKGL